MMLINYFANNLSRRIHKSLPFCPLNILDIGCGSFIPEHLLYFSSDSNFLGCDPDPIGLEKTSQKLARYNFLSSTLINCGASNVDASAYLNIQKKRTGSYISYDDSSSSIQAKLTKSSNLQIDFDSESANVIKIDAEGHELNVIQGLDLSDPNLFALEVEVSLYRNERLAPIVSSLESHGFFLATLRTHNQQTISSATIKSSFLLRLYTILGSFGLTKYLDFWTDLSGSSSMISNKSFLYQIELVFIRNSSTINTNLLPSYIRVLIIYGFVREAFKLARDHFGFHPKIWHKFPLIFPNR